MERRITSQRRFFDVMDRQTLKKIGHVKAENGTAARQIARELYGREVIVLPQV